MITSNKKFYGTEKELLLIGEGYIARPVTVDKNTVAGLQPDEEGRYIVPQGTYLYGANGESLLLNPQQLAVEVVPTTTKATVTINSVLQIDAKQEGALTYTITLAVGTDGNSSVVVSGTGTGKTVTVTLPVDSIGNVTMTYDDVVDLINNDMEANTYVVASIATGEDGTTTAAAGTDDLDDGGVDTVSSNIDGILVHSVDVTLGENIGAMMIAGYIDVDKMPAVPGAAVKAKLPNITFARKD